MPTQNFTPKIDSQRALAMYDEGASDAQIARVMGTTSGGVCYWRQRHGLPRAACNDNRISSTQYRQAKNLLKGGANSTQVAAHLGISSWTVRKLRREMSDEGLRPARLRGASIRNAVVSNVDLPTLIERAIGMRVPADIRREAVNAAYVEVLDGQLRIEDIETAAPRFRSMAFEMAGYNHSTRSIDEVNDDGFSLCDVLADPDWERPFDEVLERIFANND